MQQQVMQMPVMASSFTTHHIQHYLDENKELILKIIENQSKGKHAEFAQNQARLQHNLMYLAAIAECQPYSSSISDQQSESQILYEQDQLYSTLHQQQQLMQTQPKHGHNESQFFP